MTSSTMTDRHKAREKAAQKLREGRQLLADADDKNPGDYLLLAVFGILEEWMSESGSPEDE